jgi:hypothetical protein
MDYIAALWIGDAWHSVIGVFGLHVLPIASSFLHRVFT